MQKIIECAGGTGEHKGYHDKFVLALFISKGYFMLVCRFNAKLLIVTLAIQTTKHISNIQAIQKLTNAGYRVSF